MSRSYKIKGHETFGIREGWISKGIIAVQENPKVFGENFGTDALGVGTNMAKSIRYWLGAAGLTVKKKEGTYLTEFGKLLYEYDRYVEDITTLWLLHIHIAKNVKFATSWNLFFRRGMKEGKKAFDRDELFVWMKRELQLFTGEEELSERSVQDDCTVLLQMYCQRTLEKIDPEDKKISPFCRLHLLKKEGGRYRRTTPKSDTLHPFVVWYVLSEMFAQSDNVNIQTIVQGDNSPGSLLHLGQIEINYYLDLLEEEGLIDVNRTAGLDMVYEKKVCGSMDIIRNYYMGGRKGEAVYNH